MLDCAHRVAEKIQYWREELHGPSQVGHGDGYMIDRPMKHRVLLLCFIMSYITWVGFGRAARGHPRRARSAEAAHRKRDALGAKQLWSGLESVRDIDLTAFEPVAYPRMMQHLL